MATMTTTTATTMLHKSFAACAYASFIVAFSLLLTICIAFVVLDVNSSKSEKNKEWNKAFCVFLFSFQTFLLFRFILQHQFVVHTRALFDNFWSCNQNSKPVEENALKSMGNHFVGHFLYAAIDFFFLSPISSAFHFIWPFCSVVMCLPLAYFLCPTISFFSSLCSIK